MIDINLNEETESQLSNSTLIKANVIFLYNNNKDIVNLLLNKGILNAYKEINKLVLYKIVKKLIKLIDRIPRLNGEQKKTILIDFIIHVINTDLKNINTDLKTNLILLVEELLPDLIDVLVEAWQEVDWKLIFRKIKKCFTCCCK